MKNLVVLKTLAIVGTVLTLFPLLFMLITSFISSIGQGEFLIDYLLPAELGVVAAIGVIFLVLSAWRVRWVLLPLFMMTGNAMALLILVVVGGERLGFAVTLVILFDILTGLIGILGIIHTWKLFSKKTV